MVITSILFLADNARPYMELYSVAHCITYFSLILTVPVL